jgi:hypothetical protein
MKTKSLTILSAIVASLFALGTTLYAQTGGHGIDSRTTHPVIEAKGITKAEAEKKYPPSKGGGYPFSIGSCCQSVSAASKVRLLENRTRRTGR